MYLSIFQKKPTWEYERYNISFFWFNILCRCQRRWHEVISGKDNIISKEWYRPNYTNFFITLIYEIYLMISRNTSNEENQLRQPYMRQISTSIRTGLVCIILLSQYQTSWSLRACVMNTRHQRKKTIREIMSESRKTCDKYQHVIIIFSIFLDYSHFYIFDRYKIYTFKITPFKSVV